MLSTPTTVACLYGITAMSRGVVSRGHVHETEEPRSKSGRVLGNCLALPMGASDIFVIHSTHADTYEASLVPIHARDARGIGRDKRTRRHSTQRTDPARSRSLAPVQEGAGSYERKGEERLCPTKSTTQG